jgi:hypothetical protein
LRPKPPLRTLTRFALPRFTSSCAISSTWRSWRSMYPMLDPSGAVTAMRTNARSSCGASSLDNRNDANGQPSTSSRTRTTKSVSAPPTIHIGRRPSIALRKPAA